MAERSAIPVLEKLLQKKVSLVQSRQGDSTTSATTPGQLREWRREELWRTDPSLATLAYDPEHTFQYTFSSPTSARLPPLRLQERIEHIGSRVWDGAMVLSKYIEGQGVGQWVQGARVLELGCGTGLLGMVVARLLSQHGEGSGAPPATLLLTDLPPVLTHTQQNVEANKIASPWVHPHVLPLPWGEAGEALDAALACLGGPPHVLLCSDPAAPAHMAPRLVRTVQQLMPSDGSACIPQCLLLCTHSQREFTSPFLDGVRQSGYTVQGIGVEEQDREYRSDKHEVYRVLPGCTKTG